MKNILEAPFVIELVRMTTNMYNHGWDERNAGNISVRLDEADVKEYIETENVLRTIETGFEAPTLEGCYFIVSGTGKFFKNIQYDPEKCLGVVRLKDCGKKIDLLWGLSDGGNVTSEFPAHMMSHVSRMSADPENRVVLHAHPTNLLAMTYVHSLDEKEFTHTLWQMCTECIMFFPDGINVMPWMICGTREIGEATAEKMKNARLTVWAHHGIYGAGRSMDEAFGLIEIAEKAAEVWLKIAHLPILNIITDEQLKLTAEAMNLKVREGWL